MAITSLSLWACGGADRSFVDPGAGGTAGQAQGGGAGTTSGGTSGEAGAADGGMGGEAGTANGGSSTGGNGGTAGATGGSAGDGGTGGIIVPPDPGRPGFGLVASGNWMTSTNFKMFGAIGESPGANLVSESTNYRLAGSVIGTTQP